MDGGDRQPSDVDLLAAVREGRLDALGSLYDRYRAIAYGVAYRITADATAAEDVVQEAFLGVWRNAERYVEGRGSVKTWLLAIVHHRAVDVVRRRRPTSALPEADAPPPEALTLPDVWAEVSGRLDGVTVRAALGVLPAVQREALELAYFGGLTQQEIADRTATPLGTIKSRMRLGLLSMRRSLSEPTSAERASAERAPAEPSPGGRRER
jgi:RNA polymerase sigma-70 factor (ECF subfamily)